ncbi:hypothetical protein T439DRAFT_378939 [Meredithblackwellia eburnea MCA 4105]
MIDSDEGGEEVHWQEMVNADLLAQRDIRPLPKRQRILLPDDSHHPQRQQRPAPAHQLASKLANVSISDSQDDQDDPASYPEADEDTFAPNAQHIQPHLEYRKAPPNRFYGLNDTNHNPPLSTEQQPRSNKDSSLNSNPHSRPPPARPALPFPISSSRTSTSQARSPADDNASTSTNYFPVFGSAGDDIVRSLANANMFSSAGLFGGLGLASLHPSLVPPVSPPESHQQKNSHYNHTHTHHHHHHHDHGDDDEEEDYAFSRDRAFAERSVSVSVSNKKKRKIPGITQGSSSHDEDRDGHVGFDGDEQLPELAPYKPPGLRNDFAGEVILHKGPPADTPRTVQAALAKLRVRPPHVSLSPLTSSRRRYIRRYERMNVDLQEPLHLPEPAVYVAPPTQPKRPPPLPPGTGLKGSRAVKAANKLEKDREREKERIKKALGGDKLKLPNLWDPLGLEPSPVTLTRSSSNAPFAPVARRTQYFARKTAYPTPPASSDDGEGSHPAELELEQFEFHFDSPSLIAERWKLLLEQIERLKVAKERAAKAREEEAERRKEKEEKGEVESAEGLSGAAHSPLAAASGPKAADVAGSRARAPPVPRPADGTVPAARKPIAPSSGSAVSHPSVEPVDRTPLPPSTTTTSSSTIDPQPPSRKPPPKKGKKKRSAHANANNVHHRDNYVPSRMPVASANQHGPMTDASGEPILTSWPASEEAIAASGGKSHHKHDANYFAGPDEWLCMFCEYEIFFGEEPLLARALRKRKNVLKVRRRAKERAAKAANGSSLTDSPVPGPAPGSSVATSPSTALAS